MFAGIWGFCGIWCFLGDLVVLREVGGPRAHRGRAMASRLTRTRLYLFPSSSETLLPLLGDSAPALPNWQRLVPIPHLIPCLDVSIRFSPLLGVGVFCRNQLISWSSREFSHRVDSTLLLTAFSRWSFCHRMRSARFPRRRTQPLLKLVITVSTSWSPPSDTPLVREVEAPDIQMKSGDREEGAGAFAHFPEVHGPVRVLG